MRLAWITDIHLNFLTDSQKKEFFNILFKSKCDAVIITGDISEGDELSEDLIKMQKSILKPIYFVLGNHDYYYSSIEDVKHEMLTLTDKMRPKLIHLTSASALHLKPGVVLLGQDGWYDARLGNFDGSHLIMNDWKYISNFKTARQLIPLLGRGILKDAIRDIAKKEVVELSNNLNKALESKPKKVIILTHVPPFKENVTYAGELSDDNHMPFYSCKLMGATLKRHAGAHPEVDFLVLCGHCHSAAGFQPLPNLICKTGKAEYYKPEINEIIEV